MPKLDVRKLGTNHSDKDPLKKRKKSSIVKVKRKRGKKKIASKEHVSIYSGALDGRGDQLLDSPVESGGLIDELKLLRALIWDALNSKDIKARAAIPGLVKTAGDIYERIRKVVDGMRVVVSFKDAKFSRDVTENLANEVRDTLESASENLCPECKAAFRNNLSKRTDSMIDR